MNGDQSPPLALVKTWIDLIRSSEDDEVKTHASNMLINAFGDMTKVVEFATQHKLF